MLAHIETNMLNKQYYKVVINIYLVYHTPKTNVIETVFNQIKKY